MCVLHYQIVTVKRITLYKLCIHVYTRNVDYAFFIGNVLYQCTFICAPCFALLNYDTRRIYFDYIVIKILAHVFFKEIENSNIVKVHAW